MTRTSTCVHDFVLWNWYIFLNFYVPQHGNIFQDGAQSKYLTLLNLAIFFGVACLDDVLKRIKGRRDIKLLTAFRDLLFTTLAFPTCTHSFRLLFSLIEIILGPHRYPLKKTGHTLLAVGATGYISRILWLHSETGQWVYPVFAKLSPMSLTAFFSLSYISITSIYLLGERLYWWKWGDSSSYFEHDLEEPLASLLAALKSHCPAKLRVPPEQYEQRLLLGILLQLAFRLDLHSSSLQRLDVSASVITRAESLKQISFYTWDVTEKCGECLNYKEFITIKHTLP